MIENNVIMPEQNELSRSPHLVQSINQTPWKVVNEARRIALMPIALLYFRLHGVKVASGSKIYGLPLIQRYRGSRITIGKNLQMRNWLSSNPVGIHHRSIIATWSAEAFIEIGERFSVSGLTLCAESGIQIGNHVRMGANVKIIDSDFHPISLAGRRTNPKKGSTHPITIGDEVFIGMNSLVLKGAQIGHGAVIGAGSIVSGEIPAGVIAAGNPARTIRELAA